MQAHPSETPPLVAGPDMPEPPDRVRLPVWRLGGAAGKALPGHGAEHDLVAVEAPLEIRLHGRPAAVLMRTPAGDAEDRELVLGLLFCEAVITEPGQVLGLETVEDLPADGMAGRVPLAGHLLAISGRVGYEIIQKAAMAGIPLIAAVGAPTSLAVRLAEEHGITLVGFARRGSLNVYSHPARVTG